MRWILAGLIAVGAAGCGASSTEISNITSLTGDSASGQTLYQQNCQTCHGADAISGSAHRPVPSEAKSNPEGAVSTILSGEDEMPGFSGTLSNQQIADVLAYLKTL